MTSVAVVGVGRMGRPMSLHLQQRGFEVTAYDVAPDVHRWARDHGLPVAGTATEASASSDVVIVLTGQEAEAREAVLGDGGVLAGSHQGQVLMVVSTVSPAFVRNLAERAAPSGARVVDAPVCRGERGAVEANLLWLVGADAADLERCRPVMEACGPDVYHVGPVGAGQVGKAINNMLLWAALCADHEALDLATRHGVDPVRLRQALTQSSASNWALDNWEDMTNIPWAVKDMEIVLGLAADAGIAMPFARLVRGDVEVHHRNAARERAGA